MSPGKAGIVKVKSGSDYSVAGSRNEMSSLIPNFSSFSQKSERKNIKVVEFSLASIEFEEELGEGAFGKCHTVAYRFTLKLFSWCFNLYYSVCCFR